MTHTQTQLLLATPSIVDTKIIVPKSCLVKERSQAESLFPSCRTKLHYSFYSAQKLLWSFWGAQFWTRSDQATEEGWPEMRAMRWRFFVFYTLRRNEVSNMVALRP